MRATLADQPGALPAATPGILLRHARHPDHPANAALAAIECPQRAPQPGGIQPIGFGATRPSVDENAGGVAHPVVDAAGAPQAVPPEAVIAGRATAQNADLLTKPPG